MKFIHDFSGMILVAVFAAFLLIWLHAMALVFEGITLISL
jgi:hypothetical protein